MTLSIRTATPEDLESIERVMRASLASLGAGYYDARQLESAVRFVAVADPEIVADGTYFVVEDEGRIVACGGWSKRKKLFTGTGESPASELLDPEVDAARIRAMFVLPEYARRGIGRMILDRAEREARHAGFGTCELMATLPGVPLYEKCGYEAIRESDIELPDGVRLQGVFMSRCVK